MTIVCETREEFDRNLEIVNRMLDKDKRLHGGLDTLDHRIIKVYC